jgi:hypothetical protein
MGIGGFKDVACGDIALLRTSPALTDRAVMATINPTNKLFMIVTRNVAAAVCERRIHSQRSARDSGSNHVTGFISKNT